MSRLSKKTVLVLGTARSGTTWLAKLLAVPFRYRLLFEPFHTDHLEQAHLIADHYYNNSPAEEIIHFCNRALNDRIDSPWIRQNVSKTFIRKIPWWSKVNVIKDIRSNLFIPTYNLLYGESLKIVVIIRNPFQVVESMDRAKFPWTLDIKTLLDQTVFGEKFNIPLDKLKSHCDTKIGIFSVRWVVENGFLLKNPQGLIADIYLYENLLKDPVGGIGNICKMAGIKKSAGLENLATIPSYTTHTRSSLHSKSKNKNTLSEKNRAIVQKVLDTARIEYP